MRLKPLLWSARMTTLGLMLLLPVGPSFASDPSAAQLEEGKKLFMEGAAPPCAICHTLEAAGSTGEIGPVLDELKPDAERVIRALHQGVGAMPTYDGKLTEEQMSALAAFIVASTSAER